MMVFESASRKGNENQVANDTVENLRKNGTMRKKRKGQTRWKGIQKGERKGNRGCGERKRV
jgi:hypothetical protein